MYRHDHTAAIRARLAHLALTGLLGLLAAAAAAVVVLVIAPRRWAGPPTA